MSVTTHQRPGVYSSYDASSLISGSANGKLVGLAAVNPMAAANEVRVITGQEQVLSLFGTAGEMSKLAALCLKNGAGAVACVAVADESGYEAAFEALSARDDVSVMICDSTNVTVQQALRDSVAAASASRRERIAVVAGAAEESVEQLVARAAQLNHERVVLVAPGTLDDRGAAVSGAAVAAGVAGAIAGEADPAIPLGGAVLSGLHGVTKRYTDNELDQLILGGVTAVEEVAGSVSVIRGVTTRTTTDGTADATWRDLNSVLVIDTVIPALRNSLKAKFRRAKNTPRGRGAIRAQVVLELENFLKREIITAYDGVAVTADETDPTRALVDFSFTLAHGLNQIWISAHITV